MFGRAGSSACALAWLLLGAKWGPAAGVRHAVEDLETLDALAADGGGTDHQLPELPASEMQSIVDEVSSALNQSAFEVLAQAFNDYPVGRCGWRPDKRAWGGQGFAGPGFAGALRKFLAANESKAQVRASLFGEKGERFLVRLLKAIEYCDVLNRMGAGPRASLELVALVREEFPDLAATAGFLAYRRDLHLRWQTKCEKPDYSEFQQKMECTPQPEVPLPRDVASLAAAYNRSQLVVHIHTSGSFGPFLELLAADELTALSTCLFGDVGEGFSRGLAATPWQFLFDGPSIQEHGFLASNRDAITINRLSQGAAEEVALGSLHKTRFFDYPLQRRVPDGMRAADGDEQPCIRDVKDFMQASCGILSQGRSRGPDTDYTEIWFARAPLRGAVGIFFNMAASRGNAALAGQIEELQRLRREGKLAAIGDLPLVQGTQLKDGKHYFFSTTSFRVPLPALLKQQLLAGPQRVDLAGQAVEVPAVSGLDVRHLRSVDGIASLWREHGAALVAAFRAPPLGEHLMALPTMEEDFAALDALAGQ